MVSVIWANWKINFQHNIIQKEFWEVLKWILLCGVLCWCDCMATPDIWVDVIYIYIRYRATFPSKQAVYGTRTRDDLNQSLFYLSQVVELKPSSLKRKTKKKWKKKHDHDGSSKNLNVSLLMFWRISNWFQFLSLLARRTFGYFVTEFNYLKVSGPV